MHFLVHLPPTVRPANSFATLSKDCPTRPLLRLLFLLRLTPNPSFGKEDRAFDGPEPARYMCPVTLQEMNGSQAFVVLMSTGWVMAEKATKEVGIEGLQVSIVQ